MTVHLLKMAVGIESVDHLRAVQRQRLARARREGGTGDLRHLTRNMPKRDAEALDGGSMYWVIKGYIRVRQRLLGFDRVTGEDGRKRCALILDPDLVLTELQPQKPIQGWRYLEPEAAPADSAAGDVPDLEAAMPPDMAAELRALGLI
jgi:hypothetical protein